MKKAFILAAIAGVALVGCSKVELKVDSTPKEISFQTALFQGATKAGATSNTGSALSTDDVFGVEAFYTQDGGNTFQTMMEHQKIGYFEDTNVWKAIGKTYYWPATGYIDFIGYLPFSETPWFSVSGTSKNTISSADITFGGTEDLLYTDKAVEFTQNTNMVSDGVNNYTGVPMFFRHAGAKINVYIKAGKLDTNDVKWNVTLVSGSLKNMQKKGSLSMNLSSYTAGSAQMVEWTKPTGEVWTLAETPEKADLSLGSNVAVTTTQQTLVSDYSVLPQLLNCSDDKYGATDQYFELQFKVEQYSGCTEDTPDGIKNSEYTKTYKVNLNSEMGATAPSAWKMNYITNYYIILNPITSEITFDPAIAGWSTSGAASITINLD